MQRVLQSSVLLLLTLGASAALSQTAPAATPPARPCQADVARLCPNAHGRGELHACLQQNGDQLSAECKAHIDQVHQRVEAAREACQPDVAKFCADVKPGGGRIMACLKEHASELSDACRAQRPLAVRPRQ